MKLVYGFFVLYFATMPLALANSQAPSLATAALDGTWKGTGTVKLGDGVAQDCDSIEIAVSISRDAVTFAFEKLHCTQFSSDIGQVQLKRDGQNLALPALGQVGTITDEGLIYKVEMSGLTRVLVLELSDGKLLYSNKELSNEKEILSVTGELHLE